MQEGVLHDPNYAAWRDEITNEKRRAQTRELGGQTEGRKPKNLQVGRLEITEEKARRRARKERKRKKKIQNWGVKTRDRKSMLRDCGAERSIVSADCLSDDSESGECYAVNECSLASVFTLTTSVCVSSA